MSYEFLCKPRKPLAQSFRHDAVELLKAFHPSFSVIEDNTKPSELLASDPMFADLFTLQSQVVYEGKDLPISFTIFDDRAHIQVQMGALGQEAKDRVERTLEYVFSFANHFDLSVQDLQLETEIKEQELPKFVPKIVSLFDGILDIG